MEWRLATSSDAEVLADLALGSADASDVEQARLFLASWRAELAIEHGTVTTAIGVLPPSSGCHRGYGAWWSRDNNDDPDHFDQMLSQLEKLAASVPNLHVLQVNAASDAEPTTTRLQAARYNIAYPIWTMTHTDANRPHPEPRLPRPLRIAHWADTTVAAFHDAYTTAYQDQRLVEPHSADTWAQLTANPSFAEDLTRIAIDPDGKVVAFVLAFRTSDGGVELGPIGVIPQWRRRGVSTALISTVLTHCRDDQVLPITLTVDGDSPTGAQRLYERLGFTPTQTLTAFHRQI